MRTWIILILIGSPASPVMAEGDCSAQLVEYGRYLQAQKSCQRNDAYSRFAAAKACAGTIPQAAGLSLLDGGRRQFAREVMASGLGHMCATVFSAEPDEPASRRHRSR